MIAHTIINTIFILAQIYAVFFSSYNMILWAISLFFKEKEYPETLSELQHKFSFLICCHNEENVIADIIHSIRKIEYPSHLYEIFVVCDNCSPEDKSIQICKSLNVNVIERYNKSEKGKGYAIEYALEKMFDMGDLFIGEGIVLLDADNLVHDQILNYANQRLNAGENIVQFMVDTKNVNDSIITKTDALGFWNSSIFYQQVRHKLNLNVQLCGTSTLFRTSTLKRIGWNAKSLAEDLEMSMIYPVENDDVITFCKDSWVLDEKPLGFKASWRQKLRWIKSRWHLIFALTPILLKQSILKRDFISFDNLIYLIQPVKIILTSMIIVMGFTSYFTDTIIIFPFIVWFLLFSFYIFQLSVSLYIYNTMKNCIWILYSYVVGLMWTPLVVVAFFKRNDKSWNPTKHTQSVQTMVVEKEEKEYIRDQITEQVHAETLLTVVE